MLEALTVTALIATVLGGIAALIIIADRVKDWWDHRLGPPTRPARVSSHLKKAIIRKGR